MSLEADHRWPRCRGKPIITWASPPSSSLIRRWASRVVRIGGPKRGTWPELSQVHRCQNFGMDAASLSTRESGVRSPVMWHAPRDKAARGKRKREGQRETAEAERTGRKRKQPPWAQASAASGVMRPPAASRFPPLPLPLPPSGKSRTRVNNLLHPSARKFRLDDVPHSAIAARTFAYRHEGRNLTTSEYVSTIFLETITWMDPETRPSAAETRTLAL